MSGAKGQARQANPNATMSPELTEQNLRAARAVIVELKPVMLLLQEKADKLLLAEDHTPEEANKIKQCQAEFRATYKLFAEAQATIDAQPKGKPASETPVLDRAREELKAPKFFLKNTANAFGVGYAGFVYEIATGTAVQIGRNCVLMANRFPDMTVSQRIVALTTMAAMLAGAAIMIMGVVQVVTLGFTAASPVFFGGAAIATLGVYVAGKFLKTFNDDQSKSVLLSLGRVGVALDCISTSLYSAFTAPGVALNYVFTSIKSQADNPEAAKGDEVRPEGTHKSTLAVPLLGGPAARGLKPAI